MNLPLFFLLDGMKIYLNNGNIVSGSDTPKIHGQSRYVRDEGLGENEQHDRSFDRSIDSVVTIGHEGEDRPRRSPAVFCPSAITISPRRIVVIVIQFTATSVTDFGNEKSL